MLLPDIDTIYIDESVKQSSFVKKIIDNTLKYKKYKNIGIKVTPSYKETINEYKKKMPYIHQGKKILLLHDFLGRFVHSCPGSNGVVCCNYFVINFGANCSYDCEYCYLQSFLNNPLITLYTNIEELLDQVSLKVKKQPNIQWRIGSGEYTDSLALEPLTHFSKVLIPTFANLSNATLELKTKSANVDNLLNLEHGGNTIIGWSLNPSFIAQTVEKKTASTIERILAAKKVIEAGYEVAFHFDPIVYYENWEKEYKELIQTLFDYIPTNKIRWISLGTFRYSHGLNNVIRSRNPNSLLLSEGEMLLSHDDKTRYIASQRVKMYKFIQNELMAKDKDLFVYLCMETQGMWKRVYNQQPKMYELDKKFIQRKEMLAKSV